MSLQNCILLLTFIILRQLAEQLKICSLQVFSGWLISGELDNWNEKRGISSMMPLFLKPKRVNAANVDWNSCMPFASHQTRSRKPTKRIFGHSLDCHDLPQQTNLKIKETITERNKQINLRAATTSFRHINVKQF